MLVKINPSNCWK